MTRKTQAMIDMDEELGRGRPSPAAERLAKRETPTTWTELFDLAFESELTARIRTFPRRRLAPPDTQVPRRPRMPKQCAQCQGPMDDEHHNAKRCADCRKKLTSEGWRQRLRRMGDRATAKPSQEPVPPKTTPAPEGSGTVPGPSPEEDGEEDLQKDDEPATILGRLLRVERILGRMEQRLDAIGDVLDRVEVIESLIGLGREAADG